MSIDLTVTSARQGDAWLRHQRARIEQRHLQFGRHCRLDIGSLVLRLAQRVRVAPTLNSHRVQGPATLGDFVASNRDDFFPRQEWNATLSDLTTIVVSDWCNAPSEVGIEKAVSIVQSRAYLEPRARRLLLPFTKEVGTWRLVTIDFGTEARRHGCEFLMGFAFRPTNGLLSITSPSVAIGFALPSQATTDPIFVLTVVTAVGFPLEDCCSSAREAKTRSCRACD